MHDGAKHTLFLFFYFFCVACLVGCNTLAGSGKSQSATDYDRFMLSANNGRYWSCMREDRPSMGDPVTVYKSPSHGHGCHQYYDWVEKKKREMWDGRNDSGIN